MRFYFVFSKRFSIKKIIKWIPLIATGLLAFFGISTINAKALTDQQAPYKAQQCSYNGLFTDSNCVDLPYAQNCSLSGWFSNFACYVPDTTNTTLIQKSVWYSFTSSPVSGSPCVDTQYVSFNVDVLLNDQLTINGNNVTGPNDGPFVPQTLNYNAWGGTVTRSTPQLRSTGFMNLYWPYIGPRDGKNQTGIDIRSVKSGVGYSSGSCNFVSYGSNKSIKFTCTAKAKQDGYFIGLNVYNNGGGLGNSSTYARPSIYISQVSDPCQYGSGGAGSQDVVDSINDWGNNIINNNSSNTQSITGAITQQTNEILDGMGGIENSIDGLTDAVNSATSDIMDKQDETNDKLDDSNDKLDDVNEKLDGINESVDRLTCNTIRTGSHDGYLYVNGSIVDTSTALNNYTYTDYIKFSSIKDVNAPYNSAPSICFYRSDKSLIRCQSYNNQSHFVPNFTDGVYFRASLSKNDSIQVTYCTNLNGNTTIQSSEVSNFLSQIEEMIDDQPIQRLLSMPITLLNSFYNNVSTTTCSSYNIRLDLPGNNNLPLEFTCPNYNDLIGSSGATLLDAFMCFVLCWGIAHSAIHFYEECSSAKDTFDELYKGGK